MHTTADSALNARSLQALTMVSASTHLESDGTIPVLDPATGAQIADVPNHTISGALSAVEQADRAGKIWARTTSKHRAEVLNSVYEKLVEHRDDLALVMSREMGKTITEAYGEVQYSADYMRWFSEEAKRANGTYRESPAGGATMITTRSPVGLAVLITPWNFPMAMAARKIAPALAAGCGCVVKPATLTPLTTYLMVQLMETAGVPEGLVQVVTPKDSSSFSEAVLADSRVRKISFTGSTSVGSTLLKLAADNVLKASMELGGNAPLIVFDDADLDRAVEGAIIAKMRNGGQTCVAANRILVQDGIADTFVEAYTERVQNLIVGNPLNSAVEIGPMIDHRAVQRLEALVSDAVGKGAELKTGGAISSSAGTFFQPTVLDRVPVNADITTTEIFGDVASISRFSTEEEAVSISNET